MDTLIEGTMYGDSYVGYIFFRPIECKIYGDSYRWCNVRRLI